MAALFYLLLAVLAVELYPTGLEPLAYDRDVSLACAAGTVALGFAAGRASAARFLGRDRRGDVLAPLRYARSLALGRFVLAVAYLALIFLAHWPLVVGEALDGTSLPAIGDGLVFAPLVLSLAASWAGRLPAERALNGGTLPARAFLRSPAGILAAFAVALLLLLETLERALLSLPGVEDTLRIYPCVAWLGVAALSAGLLVVAPLALRLAMRARPLPAGELRDRLEACCARAGFRCRGLLAWDAGGPRTLNAFIAGLHPRFRHVFFSRALLERLRPAEVEAVLAHEIGHAACRHLQWYLWLSLGYLAVAAVILEGASRLVGGGELVQAAAVVLLVGAYWGGLVGYLSRRFETEADLYGARLIGDPMRFASTLERVGMFSGASMSRGGWRHFSIARRIAFLLSAARFPALEYRFRLRLRRLTALAAAGMVAGLGGALQVAATQVQKAPTERERLARRQEAVERWKAADDLRRSGRDGEAVVRLREAAVLEPGEPRLLRALGDALEYAGLRDEARQAYARAQACAPRDLRLRQYLAGKRVGR